jgi:hypothetical protein
MLPAIGFAASAQDTLRICGHLSAIDAQTRLAQFFVTVEDVFALSQNSFLISLVAHGREMLPFPNPFWKV